MDWFRAEGMDYPWRRTRDPYAILVSEAMLQQTQIATVLGRGYYARWMRRFPDWESLAAAEEEEVLRCWEGLGYYNRARNLMRTARTVVESYGGSFPDDPVLAGGLPGIGPYTCGAVLSFAFDRSVPIVDGNVSRVLARLFAVETEVNVPDGQRQMWGLAAAMVPQREAGLYNSALMELGQRICRPANPLCGQCPVNRVCLAWERGTVSQYPRKRKGPPVTAVEERVLLPVRGGRVYLCQEEGRRRRGLWRLPEIRKEQAGDLRELLRFDYPITRYRVTLMVYDAPVSWRPEEVDEGRGEWFPLDLPEAWPPLGAPYRRALERFLNSRNELNLGP
ncbi:MAG TPA: hypothetical protein PLA50_19850, partial [Bacteroidia bacterium]|nr:hypothetical protein [Bacteroidia bacterium]